MSPSVCQMARCVIITVTEWEVVVSKLMLPKGPRRDGDMNEHCRVRESNQRQVLERQQSGEDKDTGGVYQDDWSAPKGGNTADELP